MEVELKYTVAVDANAWYIRFYLWLWEAEASKITFCKLFWAYVFVLPALIVRGVAYPVKVVLALIEWRQLRSPKAKTVEPPFGPAFKVPVAKKPKPKRHPMQAVLRAIETAGAKLVMIASMAPKPPKVLTMRIALGLGVLIGLGIVGTILYFAIIYFSVTQWVLIGIAAAAVGFGVMAVLAMGLASDPLVENVWQPAGRGIQTGAMGFKEAMRAGYVAVKSNTCPRIEVRQK